jgi:hypothetical protein
MRLHSRPFMPITILVTLMWSAAMPAVAPPAIIQPSPRLSPTEVVRRQLEALQHNDDPSTDSGIAAAFAMASPQNRAQTGPLARFIRMVHENYPELLNHRDARLPAVRIHGDEAWQPVELTDRDGRRLRYLFILRRQIAPPCPGCWMTDGVIPAESQQKAPGITL